MKTLKQVVGIGALGVISTLPLSALAETQHAGAASVTIGTVSHILATETSYSSNTGQGFKWTREVQDSRPSVAWGPAENQRSGFKWTEDENKHDDSPVVSNGSNALTLMSFPRQAGFKWGIRTHSDQSGFKWGIRSQYDQAGFKWGIRNQAKQAGFKWGIRSFAYQSGFKWGIRNTAEQSGFKWGFR
jgi:hypothetical protein